MDLDTQPQTFTVEEAARILRIGRTTAYALAPEWRATRGRSGLPVLEFGRSLRVPRAALAELLDTPATQVPDASPSPPPPPTRHATAADPISQEMLWPGDATTA
jgi:excisionase family DNA binding protein